MYLSLFVMLRVILKREAASLGMADLLLVALISNAAQNALVGQSLSIPNALIVIVTIIFWNYLLDWLVYRFPSLRRFILPKPLLLVKDGSMQLRNMRKELISREELISHMREQGIDTITRVREAWMEGDGHISILTYQGNGEKSAPVEKDSLG
jgi:uncharacterized membrane protein YcaP (DUF421 family)